MAAESKTTTDHNTIKKWAEARGGKPASVKRTASDQDVGLLRIDFPGYSGGASLEEISWEEFFAKFDEKKLAFLYQEHISSGEESRFFKLVSRDMAEHKSESASHSHKADSGTHKDEAKTSAHKDEADTSTHKTDEKSHKGEAKASTHKADEKSHKDEAKASTHKSDEKSHKDEAKSSRHKSDEKSHKAESKSDEKGHKTSHK